MSHFIGGTLDATYEGTFAEAFISEDLLENPAYNNKYNAFLHGSYVESVIVNHRAPNDLKALFVSHSYGRPAAQYLSLFFAETRYLDPQEGRYNDSLTDYIEEYQPDVVIVMYDGQMNVG